MRPITLLTLTALLATSLGASAQSYRWTDPATGRTIFSDQPPPSNIKARRNAGSADTPAPEAQLPLALREPVRRFPVLLYTAASCTTICDNARAILRSRGIPHVEKTIDSQAGIDELRSVSGQELVPTMMVGAQATRGFEPGIWNSILDTAGYPQTAPTGFRPEPVKAVPAGPAAPEKAPLEAAANTQ